jgi:hypothetical protein
MGNPQITDRMKQGPTEALRALFAGLGRILMVADRTPDRAASTSGRAAGEQSASPADQAAGRRTKGPAAPADSRWRSLDETGNVRLLSAEDLDDGQYEGSEPARPADGASVPPAAQDAAAPAAAEAAALPLASYDTLSLASIRARLRSLDADQLRTLANYERVHAERPEVLGMLERRIQKLETGG